MVEPAQFKPLTKAEIEQAEARARHTAQVDAATKSLTQIISAKDGQPGVSAKDITEALHLFGGMSEAEKRKYLDDHMQMVPDGANAYEQRIAQCLQNSHEAWYVPEGFISPGGVVKALAEEALLPPEQRAKHQLTRAHPVSADEPPCTASLTAEKGLLQAVDGHGPAATTPAVPQSPQKRGK